MLNEYMNSDEYCDMIDHVTDESKKYKANEKDYLDELEKLNLDKDTYYSIDTAVTFMVCATKDAAYKKGFQDGVRLIMECMSSGNSPEIAQCDIKGGAEL